MGQFRIDMLDCSSATLVAASTRLIVRAFADPERYNAARVEREIAADDSVFYRRFFVAMSAGEVLGIGGIKAAEWASHTHILYLSAVSPEQRGRGIGRALIKARLEWLQKSFDAGRILVSASKSRRFRDLGFQEVRNSRVDDKRLMLLRF